MSDQQPHEVERISDVYDQYKSDEHAQARWSLDNPGNRIEWDQRRSLLKLLLEEHGFSPLSDKRVLDIGCGRGRVLAEFQQLGIPASNLFGVDLLPHRIEEAKQTHPDMSFSCGDAQSLEFEDASFDVVLLFTVLSSILGLSMQQGIVAEIDRILPPGGGVLVYDFRVNNPKNPHTRAIRREHLEQLFPAPRFQIDARSTTLLPPLARRLGPATSLLYPVLRLFPPLRSHYLSLVKKLT